MNDASWFESWFNSPYYHLLYKDRDESEARPFIERLTKYLQLPPHARVLDLACGKGRHSISLADLGYVVLGIDIAPENIAATNQLQRPGLSFSVHDMRIKLDVDPFDAVLNLFTSFGYFETDEEHQKAIQTMALALKPGGKLVIDYLNVDQAIAQLIPEEHREIEGVQFRVQRLADAHHLIKKIEVLDPNKQNRFTHTEKVAAFRLADFTRMLSVEGLTIKEVFGNYQLEKFDNNCSPRMIMICERA
jgi:SAM-dependent methyltransferase